MKSFPSIKKMVDAKARKSFVDFIAAYGGEWSFSELKRELRKWRAWTAKHSVRRETNTEVARFYQVPVKSYYIYKFGFVATKQD